MPQLIGGLALAYVICWLFVKLTLWVHRISTTPERQRPVVFTAFLLLIVLVGALASAALLPSLSTALSRSAPGADRVSFGTQVWTYPVSVLCALGLLCWRKWGALGLLAAAFTHAGTMLAMNVVVGVLPGILVSAVLCGFLIARVGEKRVWQATRW